MNKTVLITGASGYIGGHLIRCLTDEEICVRGMARRPEQIRSQMQPGVEIVAGDLLDAKSLVPAFTSVDVAFYLVHSMGSTGDFEEQDRQATVNFVAAAKAAGVRRIIYLGGLANPTESLSKHLRSRLEVGDILRESDMQVVEFRASVIVGAGSLSFEMVRSLVERLPIMITPKWVAMPCQPIGIADVLAYLTAAISMPFEGNPIFEIGGADVVTYGEMMRDYARQRNLRRLMIPVPLLTPRLSSLWLGLVTPLYVRIGRKLIEGVANSTVVSDPAAMQLFAVKPMTVHQAIAGAIQGEDQESAQPRWFERVPANRVTRGLGGARVGNRLIDFRSQTVAVSPEEAFAPIRRIGGATGWYYANGLWRIRGMLDQLAGGIGLRRGRLNPESIKTGDVIDFWRVEAYEENRRLRLIAEMKVPGRAWLEFAVIPANGGTTISQTAIFDPLGLVGLLYWCAVCPLHHLIFAGMLERIAKMAERNVSL